MTLITLGLHTGHSDQYGMEALNTLLDVLETNRDDFVVILAGYPGWERCCCRLLYRA